MNTDKHRRLILMVLAAFTWTAWGQIGKQAVAPALSGGPLPPAPAPNVALPDIGFGIENFTIQSWYQNGNTNRIAAQKVVTNWVTTAVVSPAGTNLVPTLVLTTNRQIVLKDTNGMVFGFEDAAAAGSVRRVFEIVPIDTNGIFETSTDLVHWNKLGWDPVDPAAGSRRWWRVGTWDTNVAASNIPDVFTVPLRLKLTTITNF